MAEEKAEDQRMVVQDWAHQLFEKWRARASHAFVLTGNVFDYAGRNKSGSDYFMLTDVLQRIFDRVTRHMFVLHLRPGIAGAAGAGLSFASEQMEELFRKLYAARAKKETLQEQPADPTAEAPPTFDPDGNPFPLPNAHTADSPAREDTNWRTLRERFGMRRRPQEEEIGQADAKGEAKLVMDLPVPLRAVYLGFPETKKQVVRSLAPPDRIQFVLDEYRHGDAGGNAGTEYNGGEALPQISLPRHPRDIWPFLYDEIFSLSLADIEELLPAERGRFEAPSVLIVHRPEFMFATGPGGHLSDDSRMPFGTIMAMGQDEEIRRRGNLIVFITGDEKILPESILDPAQGFETLDIPYHDDKERKVFVERLPERLLRKVPKENRASEALLALPQGMTSGDFARGPTAGLRLVDLEALGAEACVRAEEDKPPIFSLDAIWERKRVYLERRSGKQIAVKRPVSRFEWIGGHNEVKNYFLLIADRLRRGDVARIPKGIILVGPPGTGKTVLCQALAAVTGYSYAEIRNEKDPFLGMSTRNRTRNRNLILSLAPVVVFEDEFESKHLPRGAVWHGDSGVTAEMDAMEREFFADDARRGKVVWIAATNRPDQIESAMIRPGRFDRIIPVLPPKTSEGWVNVFLGIARKMSETHDGSVRWDVPEDALLEIVKAVLPEGITQGHINEFCYRAIHFAGEDGRITPEALKRGIDDYPVRPDKEYERQIKLALQYANSRELVPPEYRVGVPVEELSPEPQAVMVSQIYEKPPKSPETPDDEGGAPN